MNPSIETGGKIKKRNQSYWAIGLWVAGAFSMLLLTSVIKLLFYFAK